MLKKLTPFLVIGAIIAVIVLVFLSLASKQNMIVIQEGNLAQLPLEMKLNKYQDSDCGMVIEDFAYASQVVAQSGKTWFFHDHGGFVHWLEDKEFKDEAKIWVMSRDTKRWIDAKEASYSLNEITPMGYGFGAYEMQQEDFVDFETMRLKMLRGETMNNPLIKKQLLGK
ncbi:nitrous oxide reductase accessory protein NosL [bacterium]|nr:nitrous oxide reductase accessory protein NosL [bacterium]MBU1435547.1 nitrous oxide reductase accessory protein NosL [bacterium]MBU1502529.1 nitrous oxide reductase accessory protein NosL [bacterium]